MMKPPVHPNTTVPQLIRWYVRRHTIRFSISAVRPTVAAKVSQAVTPRISLVAVPAILAEWTHSSVPRPSRYVPDWIAFGSGGGAHLKNVQQDATLSNQSSVTSGKGQKVKLGGCAMQCVRVACTLPTASGYFGSFIRDVSLFSCV